MGLTIKFNHPHFPEGTVFGIPYIGQVENGGSLDVDEDAERQYVAATGRSLAGIGSSNEMLSVSGDSSLNKDELAKLVRTNEDIYGVTTADEVEPVPAPVITTAKTEITETTPATPQEGVTKNA